jgi:hypothetical protein
MNEQNLAALKIVRMGIKAFEKGDLRAAASIVGMGASLFDGAEFEHLVSGYPYAVQSDIKIAFENVGRVLDAMSKNADRLSALKVKGEACEVSPAAK